MAGDRPSLGAFPSTRRSIIAAVRDDDPKARRAAFDALISVYWRPVYTQGGATMLPLDTAAAARDLG